MRCHLRTEGWADAVAGLPKEVQAFKDGSLVGVVAPTEELAEKAASKLQRLLKWDVEVLPNCLEGGVDLVEGAPAMDSQVCMCGVLAAMGTTVRMMWPTTLLG